MGAQTRPQIYLVRFSPEGVVECPTQSPTLGCCKLTSTAIKGLDGDYCYILNYCVWTAQSVYIPLAK